MTIGGGQRVPKYRPTLVDPYREGRVDSDRPHLSPRPAAQILLTRPDRLTAGQQEALAGLEGACPEMTALAGPLLRRPAGSRPGQRRQAQAVDRRRARCGPAPRALIHPRP